jgi:hypothetical protein
MSPRRARQLYPEQRVLCWKIYWPASSGTLNTVTSLATRSCSSDDLARDPLTSSVLYCDRDGYSAFVEGCCAGSTIGEVLGCHRRPVFSTTQHRDNHGHSAHKRRLADRWEATCRRRKTLEETNRGGSRSFQAKCTTIWKKRRTVRLPGSP